MDGQIDRTQLSDRRPVVIVCETRRKRWSRRCDRQDHVVVLIPVVVALPPLHTQIVEPGFGHLQLRSGKRFSPKTAGGDIVIIRKRIRSASRRSVKGEVLNSETFPKIE